MKEHHKFAPRYVYSTVIFTARTDYIIIVREVSWPTTLYRNDL